MAITSAICTSFKVEILKIERVLRKHSNITHLVLMVCCIATTGNCVIFVQQMLIQ